MATAEETIKNGANAAGKGFKPSFGLLLNVGMNLPGYFDYRAEGKGRLNSLAHTAFDMILPEFLGWKLTLGFQLAEALPGAAVGGLQKVAQVGREYERAARDQSPFRTNTFVDSQQIYTMRQAGMALAEQSKYQLHQTMMGNEARFMHR